MLYLGILFLFFFVSEFIFQIIFFVLGYVIRFIREQGDIDNIYIFNDVYISI